MPIKEIGVLHQKTILNAFPSLFLENVEEFTIKP